MDGINDYFSEQRRRAEDHISYTNSSRHDSRRRSRSPPPRGRSYRDENPSSSVKIRDMPSTINERDIKEFLDENRYEYSTVRLVRDRRTGQSRGVAFIEFYSIDDAKRCIEERSGEAYIRGYSMPLSYCFNKESPEDFGESRGSARNDSYLNDDPTNTIMLRGIPTSFSERDIRDDLEQMGILYTDVRLIRDKRTGMSRGFGFVEFDTVLQAQQWMESQQGVFYVGKYDLRMIYSAPRNAQPTSCDGRGNLGILGTGLSSSLLDDKGFGGDWTCIRCGTHNFKRRNYCFKCHVARHETQPLAMEASDGTEYVGTTPCNTLTLHDLDALTTEETIRSAFEGRTGFQIKNVKVMRDEVTSVSHCYAFVELNSIAESCEVVETFAMGKQKQIFEIDGKAVTINYAKNTYSTILASIDLQKSQRQAMYEQQQQQMVTDYGFPTADDPVNASYAGNATANAAAAVAQAALQQKQAQKTIAAVIVNSLHSSVSSTIPFAGRPFDAATALTVKYPTPDTTKFVYEETSGFYYDGSTGLYYDQNSTYFYDQKTQTYFYWDQKSSRYLPASMLQQPQQPSDQQHESSTPESEQARKEKEKKEKARTAKRIAKDMERWAKQMNKQSNSACTSLNAVAAASKEGDAANKTADMGFAMLEAVNNLNNSATDNQFSSSMSSAWSAGSTGGLVAHYGGDSDNEDYDNETPSNSFGVHSETKISDEEEKLIDWSKLACLLCSRGFKDIDTLNKHRTVSDLHKKNLDALRRKLGLPTSEMSNSGTNSNSNTPSYSAPSDSPKHGGLQYRDRAKERREKFGIPSPPRSRSSKSRSKVSAEKDREEAILPPPPPPPPQSSTGEDNVGSRLMQKMGWNLGQGLGRANQGRTDIIEPEFRQTGVGLGASETRVGGGPPSDNYKDNVKKAMFARYNNR